MIIIIIIIRYFRFRKTFHFEWNRARKSKEKFKSFFFSFALPTQITWVTSFSSDKICLKCICFLKRRKNYTKLLSLRKSSNLYCRWKDCVKICTRIISKCFVLTNFKRILNCVDPRIDWWKEIWNEKQNFFLSN